MTGAEAAKRRLCEAQAQQAVARLLWYRQGSRAAFRRYRETCLTVAIRENEMTHPLYHIEAELPYAVAIVDDHHPGHPSRTVTNAAEEVVLELLDKKVLDGKKRLVYRDSQGMWDEIIYNPEGAVAFAPIRVTTLAEALAHARLPLGT